MILPLALANTIPVAALAAACAFVATRGARSAATRHAIWTAALLLAPSLAAIIALVPRNAVGVGGGGSGVSLLVVAWAVVAGARVIRLIAAHRAMRRMDRQECLSSTFASRRRVDVRVSDGVPAPLMAGCGRAVILIPRALLATFDRADLDRVIEHELAHANRYDDVTRAVQELIKALCFFNPFVYVISRRIDVECELACDAAAARASGGAERYAATLARLALVTAGANRLTTAAVSHGISVTRRIELLLHQPATAFGRARFASALAISLLSIALSSPLLMHRLISLDHPTTRQPDSPDGGVDAGAEHYFRGLSLYWGGHYKDAAEEFRAAYNLGYERDSSAVSLAAAEAAVR